MPNLQEIIEAIDAQLVELRAQIASLEAARQALTGIPTAPPSGRAASTPAVARRAPAATRRARTTPPAEATPAKPPARRRRTQAPAAAAPTPARSTATRSTGARPTAAAAPKPKPASRSRRRELEPGQIEALLQESADGLSLVALARRTGVSETKVAERLRTLERSGDVRSTGPRRTSLWRVVTVEERIAERAAELARASSLKQS